CGGNVIETHEHNAEVKRGVAARRTVTASPLRKKKPENPLPLFPFGLGTTRAALSHSITQGKALSGRVPEILSRESHPHTRQAKKARKTYEKTSTDYTSDRRIGLDASAAF